MKTQFVIPFMQTQISASILATLCLLAGCATTGYQKADSTSTLLMRAAKGVEPTQAALDETQASLSDLIDNPEAEMELQFNRYDAAVAGLETRFAALKDQVDAIKAEGHDYTRNWNADLSTIQNDDIRERSQERQRTVRERLDDITESYANVASYFSPYLSDLRDIRTALATDLTTGGIGAIRPLANKTKITSIPVRQSLEKLSDDFQNLGTALSSSAPQDSE